MKYDKVELLKLYFQLIKLIFNNVIKLNFYTHLAHLIINN